MKITAEIEDQNAKARVTRFSGICDQGINKSVHENHLIWSQFVKANIQNLCRELERCHNDSKAASSVIRKLELALNEAVIGRYSKLSDQI